MRPRDWLLVLLAPTSGTSSDLDPLRIQKGMFYVSRLEGVPAGEKYDFVPYYYGPCSFQIYDDLETLADEGLVRRVPVPGKSWSKYALTEHGAEQIQHLLGEAGDTAKAVKEARRRVSRKGFAALLKEVYSEYPEFASNSIADLP